MMVLQNNILDEKYMKMHPLFMSPDTQSLNRFVLELFAQ